MVTREEATCPTDILACGCGHESYQIFKIKKTKNLSIQNQISTQNNLLVMMNDDYYIKHKMETL